MRQGLTFEKRGGNETTFTMALLLGVSPEGVNWAHVGTPACSFSSLYLYAAESAVLALGADGVLYESDFLSQRLGQRRWLPNGQLEWTVTTASNFLTTCAHGRL
jgi:hypothetical protein